jgi:hypothetical protein
MIAIHSTGGDLVDALSDGQLGRALAAIADSPTEPCLNWLLSTDQIAQFARDYVTGGRPTHGLLPTGGSSVPATLGARIRSAAIGVASAPDYPGEGLAAVNDAAKYADRFFGDLQPIVFVSSDGTVMLQWPSETNGVALVFVGDGTVVISKRNGSSGYARNGVEYSIETEPPAEIVQHVRGIKV